ncbi:hypothetical protein AB0K00_11520 [Dactylosporangium sp. NPDC049525]|uniref:hypothetical protein n=1 Tax=Dactylosporangium sp. NPDC049525 TaxID=3154730 RepID=UPI003412D3BE
MSEILWRMPKAGERPEADLRDGLTAADLAEALVRTEGEQRRVELSELRLAVTAPSRGTSRLIRTLLIRDDGSFVWRIRFARLATLEEIEQWAKQTGAA